MWYASNKAQYLTVKNIVLRVVRITVAVIFGSSLVVDLMFFGSDDKFIYDTFYQYVTFFFTLLQFHQRFYT